MRNGLQRLGLFYFVLCLTLVPAAPCLSQDQVTDEPPAIPLPDIEGEDSSGIIRPEEPTTHGFDDAPEGKSNGIAEQTPFGFCAPPCVRNPFD